MSRPEHRRPALAGLAVLVAAAHVLALAWITRGGAAGGGQAMGTARSDNALHAAGGSVRLRLLGTDALAGKAAGTASIEPPAAASPAPTARSGDLFAPPAASAAAQAGAAPPKATTDASDATDGGGRGGSGGSGEEYLPRSALSAAPQVLGAVMLEYPPQAPPGRWQGELTLFIDETGQVRRVRVDSGEAQLPAPFQEAARQAFLGARFTPGEVSGRAVRSRIRIAVDFEAQEASGTAHDRAAP